MTAETLNSYNCKDLAEMARRRGVQGWREMRKEQLIRALLRAKQRSGVAVSAQRKAKPVSAKNTAPARRSMPVGRQAIVAKHPAVSKGQAKAVAASVKPTAAKPSAVKPPAVKSPAANGSLARATNGHASNGAVAKLAASNGEAHKVASRLPQPAKRVVEPPKKESAVARRLQSIKSKSDRLKNLSSNTPQDKPGGVRDRLVVMVRDAYWLHANWELSRHGVERAQAAMGQEWHTSKPVLRLFEVSEGGTTSAAESIVRDIDIHGGVSNWYIDVQHPPKSYRLDIGYVSSNGKMFVLARSNVVSTPKPGVKDALDENWTAVAEDYEKIYAMSGGYAQDGGSHLQELFEERLRRPMGSPMVTQYGSGADALMPRRKEFDFQVDAELIVYGVSEPDAHVTLQGDPVKLRPDGSFTVRFGLPNCRQVIPAVACSANGLEQRTVVLAIERNTKVMEPLVRDANE
ncbi:MAG TPA: DUF4912 domain-containing protein [Pirellulales bacterium]|jgi:hypothetical protein|nr:DUF4912 domain-containing protein [Pirellulales bacterium]